MIEKRRFPRLMVNAEVSWVKSSDAAEETPANLGAVKDISAGGICCILDDWVKCGDILEMDIALPDGENIHSQGKVVWMNKFEIFGGKYEIRYEGGVEFLNMRDEVRDRISKYIYSHSNKPVD